MYPRWKIEFLCTYFPFSPRPGPHLSVVFWLLPPGRLQSPPLVGIVPGSSSFSGPVSTWFVASCGRPSKSTFFPLTGRPGHGFFTVTFLSPILPSGSYGVAWNPLFRSTKHAFSALQKTAFVGKWNLIVFFPNAWGSTPLPQT